MAKKQGEKHTNLERTFFDLQDLALKAFEKKEKERHERSLIENYPKDIPVKRPRSTINRLRRVDP